MPNILQNAVSLLVQNNFKVLKPIDQMVLCETPKPDKTLKLAVIDVETTGLDFSTHEIIELAIITAEYCPQTGQIFNICDIFEAFEQPQTPISFESTQIHGITNDMVQNQKIDDSKVISLLENTSLIIAHNAAFDRRFLEKRFPIFQSKSWACSFSQIPWKENGISSGSLEFIAYKMGFHYISHRAKVDCLALLYVLNARLKDSNILKILVDKTLSNSYKISPLNTHFESKDYLKNRGYRWDAENRFWSLSIENEESIQIELNWLCETIYRKKGFRVEKETSDAFNRFSNRIGKKEIVVVD